MENAEEDRYMPPKHFKRLDKFESLAEEATADNTELWLVRIPSQYLGPHDLVDKQWRMHTAAADGKLGHFFNSQGDCFSVVKEEKLEGPEAYAFVPISSTDSFAVRSISHSVSFVRAAGREAAVPGEDRSEREIKRSVPASEETRTPPPKRPIEEPQERHTVAGKGDVPKQRKKQKKSRRESA